MSLSVFIERDLKSRIQSGDDLPLDLSLIGLSQRYGVSITPIRKAISALVAEGFIVRLPNKRLRINPVKIGTGVVREDVDRPPSPSDWDEIFLVEVMHESLRKHVVQIRENSLAEKYNVGRSVIRHTFSRFAGAGLLEHVPRRGWRVQPFREEDSDVYLAVREVLELKALELAKTRIQKNDLKTILDGEIHELNNTLHQYLIDKSGNRYIIDFFRQYLARYYTKLFYYAAPEASVVEEMTAQHQAILEALIEKKWTAARQVLSEHIRAQKRVLKKLLV